VAAELGIPSGDPYPTPPPLKTAGLLLRLAVIAVVVGGIAVSFLYCGGWLTPGALTQDRMIDRFEEVNGPHPGFRRNHAKGVCITGYFDSNGNGVAISKAAIFAVGRVPVLGRFAFAGGQPYVADTPGNVRSLAVLFKLPTGEEWRSGMVDIPVFPVATPQAFYDQLAAFAPDPATGKPDPAKVHDFLGEYPESAKALPLILGRAVSSGFENGTFNALDAFRFINANGDVANVRWSMVSLQPFEPVSATQPAQVDKNYLFDALIASVHDHPLQWRLVVTIADPGDPTNDATLPWPPGRRQIDAGTLTVDHIESEDTSPIRDINFDPLILPSGIASSDDPLLSARSAAYSVSFTRREGESKQPSAVSSAETGK
jgi:catalase